MSTIGLAHEEIPAGEEAATEHIVDSLRQMLTALYPPGTRPMRRDAHPKHHAVVVAEFTVGNDVPHELRHGVFAKARTFPALLRLSNSAPRDQPDLIKDVRGFAIKLLGVEGPKLLEDERDAETQDFVMASAPAFFVRNALEYKPFTKDVVKKRPLRFFWGRGEEFMGFMKANIRIKNPLGQRYWSQSPFLLGPHAVKYSAVPTTAHVVGRVGLSRNYLRANLAAHLRDHEATFDFMVQLQTDPIAMPIEDPTIRWDETVSPFRKVATIRIPKQICDSPEQLTFAENLSFTPWHSLPEHRPLGGINRIRKVVYREISQMRHHANRVVRREPQVGEPVPGSVLK
jgi:hypothetical protein